MKEQKKKLTNKCKWSKPFMHGVELKSAYLKMLLEQCNIFTNEGGIVRKNKNYISHFS
jgi:hypothetical protein